MLMDEPFGAVDPIRRERLQNELLRLQEQVRKTIIFVTHDVDEAIKMGDRIAILQRGGILAQYATPAEILASPASEFVERFVGADRGLKRLSLARVRDLELRPALTVEVGSGRARRRGGASTMAARTTSSWSTRRTGRSAGSIATTSPATGRSTPTPQPRARRPSSPRRRCATRSPPCWARAFSWGSWWTAATGFSAW